MLSRAAVLLALFASSSLVVSLVSPITRREAFSVAIIGSSSASLLLLPPATSIAAELAPDAVPYEFRNRNGNKGALIREDYWYMMGKNPPRRMGEGMMKADDPKWNAFGTCGPSGSSSTNSCTYVPLSQRIPAYSKYAFLIGLGAKEFSSIGKALDAGDWKRAESMLEDGPTGLPAPCVDALLKMILFASLMLTTPNYSGPSKELLVARFYANEAGFATNEVAAAVEVRDLERAKAALEFGRDSWNSYFVIVNRQISPKVGDKFEYI